MPNLEEVFNFVVVAVVAGGVLLLLFSPFLIAALRDNRSEFEQSVDAALERDRNAPKTLTGRILIALPALVIILFIPVMVIYGLIAKVF